MLRVPAELREFLHPFDPSVQSLVIGLRTVVIGELAPCREHIFQMRARVVLVYSATERVIKDAICLIVVYRKHVNLGFAHGKSLRDPGRLLEGSGKRMRHVTLKRLSELDRPELRGLLRAARRHAGLARPRDRATADVVTTIKRPGPPRTPWPEP